MLRPPSRAHPSKDSSLGLKDLGFPSRVLSMGDLGQGAAPGATKALQRLAPVDFPNFTSVELRSPDHSPSRWLFALWDELAEGG